MTIEFCWVESDYVSTQCSRLLHHPGRLLRDFFWPLSIITFSLILAIIVIATHHPDWRAAFDLAVAIPLFIAVPCLVNARWQWHKQFQRVFSTHINTSATIDEKGVTLEGNIRKAHLWVGFTGIYESRRVVLMVEGGENFIFLPKCAMSAAQMAELRRFAVAATLDCPVILAPPLA
ncbi:MAG: YcxB family protein [Candidatus Acidiferrales bacterium]